MNLKITDERADRLRRFSSSDAVLDLLDDRATLIAERDRLIQERLDGDAAFDRIRALVEARTGQLVSADAILAALATPEP